MLKLWSWNLLKLHCSNIVVNMFKLRQGNIFSLYFFELYSLCIWLIRCFLDVIGMCSLLGWFFPGLDGKLEL